MIYDFQNYTYNGLKVLMEFWKPVTDEMVPGIIDGFWISNIGNLYNSVTGKFSNAKVKPNDYIRVLLPLKDGTKRMTTIHRLVCMAFNGMPPDLSYEVDHINCDKTCSFEGNLEWVTKQENTKRAHENNLAPTAEDHYKSILSNEEVIEICQMLQKGIPINEICNIMEKKIYPRQYSGGLISIIYQILHKVSWKDITKNYNFYDYSRINFTNNEIEIACQLMQSGYSYDYILNNLGRIDISDEERERLKETLYNIKKGRFFTDISSKYNLSPRQANYLTEDEIHLVCKNFANGISFKETIQMINRSSDSHIKEAIYSIYRGKTKKSLVEFYKNQILEGSTTIEKNSDSELTE